MMRFQKFSVLMSIYYKEKLEYFKSCINSILNNSILPSEIVIVKDGKLSDELEEYLLVLCKNKLFKIVGYDDNHGLWYALNYGLDFCSTNLIARMDSDDICDNLRFEKQLLFMSANCDIKIVGSNTIEFIDSPSNVINYRVMPETSNDIMKYSKTRNPFIHPSIMVYKDVIDFVGGYRNFYLCEDYDLWARILEAGYKAYNIQENLVYMRVGKNFYKRRGGLKYCFNILKFKKQLYAKKYMNFFQFIKTSFATIVVSIAPGFIREYIYKKYLRKNM